MGPKDHFPPHACWQLGFPAVVTNGNDRKSGGLCDSHGNGTIETFCPQSTRVAGGRWGRENVDCLVNTEVSRVTPNNREVLPRHTARQEKREASQPDARCR